MNLKGCNREEAWPNLRYCLGIWWEGLFKTTKHFDIDVQARTHTHLPNISNLELLLLDPSW